MKTVLVVDDEPDIRDLLVLEFELLGHQVLQAENGKKAIEVAQANPVDLVISDIRMPGGDGVTLLKELRAKDPFSPPVILITGFADIGISQAYDLGADMVFMKPFSLMELVNSTKRIFRAAEEWAQPVETGPFGGSIKKSWPEFPGERAKGFTLGHGGFYLACPPPFPKRDAWVEFDLEFGAGPIKRLQGAGIVRWSDLSGVWVSFETLSAETLKPFLEFRSARRDASFIPLPPN